MAEMRLPCGICILLYLKCVIFLSLCGLCSELPFSYWDRW
ncbi:hypothetical protein HMPREF1553_00346 [Porphyromonas gingivalis F0568]|nr:hypothetical protein HMPREF1553_00346 [Porphyromonas gingivalis F0568]